ncbi:hypothetical protein HYW42_03365 [Candidatus Daviesbacteria bacterium]|nr:hypothetical protein [Candidatus Daviesbacteria bacterium]
MPKISQNGIIHISSLLPIVILLLGLAAALYLIANPAVFSPKADYKSDPSQAVSINGKKCQNSSCEVEATDVELIIDVNGLNSQ